jgi:hypothetical protein
MKVKDAVQVGLETMLNKGMKIKRDITLSNSDTNKANGFHDKKFNWGL